MGAFPPLPPVLTGSPALCPLVSCVFQDGLHLGPAPNQLMSRFLIQLHLKRPFFQTRSRPWFPWSGAGARFYLRMEAGWARAGDRLSGLVCRRLHENRPGTRSACVSEVPLPGGAPGGVTDAALLLQRVCVQLCACACARCVCMSMCMQLCVHT